MRHRFSPALRRRGQIRHQPQRDGQFVELEVRLEERHGAVHTRLAGNVAKELQSILARLGYYAGEITGVYDLKTKEAFRRFCSVENFEERWRDDHFADREILNFMRKRYGAAESP